MATGLDDRFRLTPEERAIGLPEDYFREAWSSLSSGPGITREQSEWLDRLEHRQTRIDVRVSKIRAMADEGEVSAMILESLIEDHPIVLRPRQDCPDCFRLLTCECLLKTPEDVVDHYDIDFLVMLLGFEGEEYDDDTPVSRLFDEANELLKFPHRAWIATDFDGRPLIAMCPVCGWEGEPASTES